MATERLPTRNSDGRSSFSSEGQRPPGCAVGDVVRRDTVTQTANGETLNHRLPSSQSGRAVQGCCAK